MDKIKILKWDAPEVGVKFSVPGRRVVFFDSQDGKLRVWTECYSNVEIDLHITLSLIVISTGFEFPGHESMAHLMSCQDWPYIWHLYQTK